MCCWWQVESTKHITDTMHGRKKQLLDSYKASSGATELSSAASSSSLSSTSTHHADMSSALNLNQSLTEQLTQQRRSYAGGNGDGPCASSRTRTPVRLSPDAPPPAGLAVPAPARVVDADVVEAAPRCVRTAASSPSPVRGGGPPRSRPTAVDEALPAAPKPQPASSRRSPADSGGPALDSAAFPPGIDPLTARLALQHVQLGLFPHPAALHPPPPSFLVPPDSAGITQHLELLYRVKYPGYPVPPPWLLYQYQDELVRDAGMLQQQGTTSSSASDQQRLQDQHALRERAAEDERNAIKDRQERSVISSVVLCYTLGDFTL